MTRSSGSWARQSTGSDSEHLCLPCALSAGHPCQQQHNAFEVHDQPRQVGLNPIAPQPQVPAPTQPVPPLGLAELPLDLATLRQPGLILRRALNLQPVFSARVIGAVRRSLSLGAECLPCSQSR